MNRFIDTDNTVEILLLLLLLCFTLQNAQEVFLHWANSQSLERVEQLPHLRSSISGSEMNSLVSSPLFLRSHGHSEYLDPLGSGSTTIFILHKK